MLSSCLRLLSFNKFFPRRTLRSFSIESRSREGKAPTTPTIRIEYLKLNDNKSLAYEKITSSHNSSKTVLYIPGFKSGKDGNKASFLRKFCLENDLTFLRYDPSSIGDSDGSLETVEFADWVENAATVLERLGSADNVLVGSSMGGWISLILASQEKFAAKISSLVMVAPAVNFIRPHYHHNYNNMGKQDQDKLDRGEVVYIKWDEEEDLPIRKSFAEKSREYELDLSEEIQVTCPVTILHGVKDESIPYQNSLVIMDKLKTDQVELIFSKPADHKFSDPDSLLILASALRKKLNI